MNCLIGVLKAGDLINCETYSYSISLIRPILQNPYQTFIYRNVTINKLMELVLVVGNLYIPDRVNEIPSELKTLITSKKYNHVISAGNLGNKEQYDWLASLGKLTSVGGLSDEVIKPSIDIVKIGDFKIGILNQTIPNDIQSLNSTLRQLDSDMLIHGSTCTTSVLNYEGKHYLCPGSLTGAYSTFSIDNNPSFIILTIQSDACIAYFYEMNKTTKGIECSKVEFSK
jgi:vacuolar protein sorting-associated protein 29